MRLKAEAVARLPRAVTHRVGKPRPDTLRLWTIQLLAVWEQLQRHQALYVQLEQVDPEDSHLLDYTEQYDWMREPMARRLPSYGGRYPWWAYLRPKPDLRGSAWNMGPLGTRYVRLELAVEPERVLLSNVDAWWGRACTDLYMEADAADEEVWYAELRQHGIQSSLSLPRAFNLRRASSWERIFEFEALARTGRFEDEVQATFERLELADVVAVTEFTARCRPEPDVC
jgi:hypothetical protein